MDPALLGLGVAAGDLALLEDRPVGRLEPVIDLGELVLVLDLDAEMVEAAGRLRLRLAPLSRPGVVVRLSGPAAMWSDFNSANKTANGTLRSFMKFPLGAL